MIPPENDAAIYQPAVIRPMATGKSGTIRAEGGCFARLSLSAA
jgi:hypothetical protein